jgi:hypothetical protein
MRFFFILAAGGWGKKTGPCCDRVFFGRFSAWGVKKTKKIPPKKISKKSRPAGRRTAAQELRIF